MISGTTYGKQGGFLRSKCILGHHEAGCAGGIRVRPCPVTDMPMFVFRRAQGAGISRDRVVVTCGGRSTPYEMRVRATGRTNAGPEDSLRRAGSTRPVITDPARLHAAHATRLP